MIYIIKVNNSKIISGDKKRVVLVEKAIEVVEKFFQNSLSLEVHFLTTREEMDKVYSSMFGKEIKTENWVVGGFFGNAKVYLFDEEVYDSVSCHEKESFFLTLVHEISHVYLDELFKFNFPMWLNEGICCVIANQYYSGKINKSEILNSYSQEEWMNLNPYKTASEFVRFLLKKYGKNRLFALLIFLNSVKSPEEFYKKFEEIFGKDISSVIEDWY